MILILNQIVVQIYFMHNDSLKYLLFNMLSTYGIDFWLLNRLQQSKYLPVVMHIKEIKWLNTFNPDVSDCSCNYLHNYAMTNVAVCTFARPMYNLNRFKNNNNKIWFFIWKRGQYCLKYAIIRIFTACCCSCSRNNGTELELSLLK